MKKAASQTIKSTALDLLKYRAISHKYKNGKKKHTREIVRELLTGHTETRGNDCLLWSAFKTVQGAKFDGLDMSREALGQFGNSTTVIRSCKALQEKFPELRDEDYDIRQVHAHGDLFGAYAKPLHLALAKHTDLHHGIWMDDSGTVWAKADDNYIAIKKAAITARFNGEHHAILASIIEAAESQPARNKRLNSHPELCYIISQEKFFDTMEGKKWPGLYGENIESEKTTTNEAC